ncbi:MAG TPA: LysR family transcriptional regulator [Hyphomonas sp.]|nr:LysR family transcriptional regulator [Hyphomonas sp.]
MNWDDLRLLLDVSRHPRLADVATRTGLDATTISRRLRRLETDLGLELFERTPKGHILTPAGQAVADRAEQLEHTASEIATLSESEGPLAAGRVRLGVPEGLGSLLIAPAMGRFAVRYPLLGLDLIALSGFVSVPKREADMSIMLTRPKAGRLKVRKLSDYALHLYAHPDYLARTGPIHTVADLADHSLIGYVDDLIYSTQLRYHEEIAPGLTPRFCSPSIVAQWQMARTGAGIAVLPHFIAGEDSALVPVLPQEVSLRRTFWLAVHEDVHATSRVRAAGEFLDDLFSEAAGKLLGGNA